MVKRENILLTEQKLSINKELQDSIVQLRANQYQTVLASGQGGIDIEQVAKETPERVVRHRLDQIFGMRSFDARDVALRLGYAGQQLNMLTDILSNLYRLSVVYDAELVESNPLVETQDEKFV